MREEVVVQDRLEVALELRQDVLAARERRAVVARRERAPHRGAEAADGLRALAVEVPLRGGAACRVELRDAGEAREELRQLVLLDGVHERREVVRETRERGADGGVLGDPGVEGLARTGAAVESTDGGIGRGW